MYIFGVIHINKDGSCIIEKTFLMNQDYIVSIMEQIITGWGITANKPDGKTPAGLGKLYNESRLINAAEDFGEGVASTSAEDITKGEFTGYKVKYTFSDINKVKFNQNPHDNL